MGKFGQAPITLKDTRVRVTVPTVQLIDQLEQFKGTASPYVTLDIGNDGYIRLYEPDDRRND